MPLRWLSPFLSAVAGAAIRLTYLQNQGISKARLVVARREEKRDTGVMKVLALSDAVVGFIYNPQVRHVFDDVDLVFGCGDLAYYYLEFVLTALNVPLFYVRGNHDKVVEYSNIGQRTGPQGGTDLHGKVLEHRGWLLAGVEGCLRYRPGQFQYTQQEMWWHVLRLAPQLLVNRLRHGRFLDVFITHAPPWGIHDRDDLPHQGIKAFRWFLKVFSPAYHFHGHVHLYRPDEVSESSFGGTTVINAYRFQHRKLVLDGAGVVAEERSVA